MNREYPCHENNTPVRPCQVTELSVTVRVVEVTLAEVVGANCKRWRNQIGLTQDKFAEFARTMGLRWTASAVGDFEAGRSNPSLATVIAVAVALQVAFGRTEAFSSFVPDDYDWEQTGVVVGVDESAAPTLADLFRTDADWVDVTGVLCPPGEDLPKLFLGGIVNYGGATAEEWVELKGAIQHDDKFRAAVASHAGVTDKRMARQLGMSVEDFMVQSIRLWGRTFTDERDKRAGAGSNQQKKGRIAREMRAELEKVRPGNGDDQ